VESDGSAAKYGQAVDLDMENSQAKLGRIAGHGRRVLDLGCGAGDLARALRERGCTVSGVELDREAAKLAEQWCDRVVVGDLDNLDLALEFGDARFDVVLAGDVLEHVKDPVTVLQQVRGILSPSGWIGVSLPNVAHGSVRLALLHGAFPYADQGLLDRTHRQFLTRDTVLRLVRDGGFTPVRVDETLVEIDDSEVPFPGGAMTDQVRAEIEADPTSRVYQYVVTAVPGKAEGLAGQLERADDELRRSRTNASQWQRRALTAEEQLDAGGREQVIATALAPLRLEILRLNDELSGKDHERELVVRLEEDRSALLREAEAERKRLALLILDVEEQRRAVERELASMQATRSWRLRNKALAVLQRVRP
jgi:2-polyprenyl-3-methyl-5-hydroxy-6-metoxy-1,4-benzoquinol methylase